LRGDNFEISYSCLGRNVQNGLRLSTLKIPVKTTQIERPSLLILTDSARPHNQALNELYKSERFNILRSHYGHLPINEAKKNSL
jgi:hypothetical protein